MENGPKQGEERLTAAPGSRPDVTPGAALQAWVDYLRDMGVYDLYGRASPHLVLTEAIRESLRVSPRAAAAGPAAEGGHGDAGPVRQPMARPGVRAGAAAPPRNHVIRPAATSGPPSEAGQRGGRQSETRLAEPGAGGRGVQRGAPEPVTQYFNTEPEPAPALPPELAAPMPKPNPLETLAPLPPEPVPAAERGAALERLREEIGDCTRCPLAYAGRHTVVFGEGDPNARLMFVGEGPGADEDASGRPFVGKAGQLLGNMITAMGLTREQVFIANIVKCRPPGNRVPEFVEATTCSQFLLRQIDIVRPEVIVALGSTAATYLLGVRQSLTSLRGNWYRVREAKVVVTFHPAFLLRDPRQKAEAWKDLQRVMAELGLEQGAQRRS